jgi:hypothetical protein
MVFGIKGDPCLGCKNPPSECRDCKGDYYYFCEITGHDEEE